MIPDAITITADLGGANERVLASDATSLEAGDAIIAGGVEIRWSRPASMLHPDPTEATLTLLKPRNYSWPDVGVETRLTISWTGAGVTTIVFDGHIDRITSHPPEGRRVAGRVIHAITIEAICPIGRLSRLRIGDTPWEAQHSGNRAQKLRRFLPGFSGAGLSEIDQPPNTDGRFTRARYLDVDSRNPIELAQELVAGHRRVLLADQRASEPGVKHVPIASRKLGAIKVTGGTASYEPATGQVASVELPAWAVDDTDRVQSFDSAISAVTVNYQLGAMDSYSTTTREVSKTWGDVNAPGTSIKIDTQAVSVQYLSVPYTDEQFDRLRPLPPQHTYFWASLVTPNNRNITRLGTLRIPWKRLGPEHVPAMQTITDLIDRFGTAVHFTGITPDVSPLQVPIAGTLILSGDPAECVLELEVEPFELSTATSVEWRTFGLAAGAVEFYQADFTFHESAYASEVI